MYGVMKLLPLFLALGFCLNAEIERVVIGFNKDLCNEKCMLLLKNEFGKLDLVNSVSVAPGQVNLGWKPNERFDFRKVDARMRFVGVGMDNIAVSVRGTVSGEGAKWYITSLGDETRFQLLNPPQPSANSYIEYNNISMYKLLPEVQDQLAEAKRNDQIVTATGFLLAPWRYPLTIILGNLNVDQPREEQ